MDDFAEDFHFFFVRSFVGRCCGVVVGRRGELWGVVVR